MAEATGLFLADGEGAGSTPWEFDSITEDSGNDFSLQAAAKNNGDNGYIVDFAGTNDSAYGEKAIAAQTNFYCRFYVYFPTNAYPHYNQGSLKSFELFKATDGQSGFNSLSLQCMASGSLLNVQYFTYIYDTPDFNQLAVEETISIGAWHYIEAHVLHASGTGAVELWIDGVSKASASSIDNNDSTTDGIKIGVEAAEANPGNGEYFYLDDIKIDTSYIGAYSDVGGISIPVVLAHQRRRRS